MPLQKRLEYIFKRSHLVQQKLYSFVQLDMGKKQFD